MKFEHMSHVQFVDKITSTNKISIDNTLFAFVDVLSTEVHMNRNDFYNFKFFFQICSFLCINFCIRVLKYLRML